MLTYGNCLNHWEYKSGLHLPTNFVSLHDMKNIFTISYRNKGIVVITKGRMRVRAAVSFTDTKYGRAKAIFGLIAVLNHNTLHPVHECLLLLLKNTARSSQRSNV